MGLLLLAVITSFAVVLLSTPSVIRVAFLKRLFDEPGDARKLHKRVTPTIGGIMIFAGTIFAFSLWFPWNHENQEQLQAWVREFQFIVATSLILFFVGIKDDIIGTAPIKKLVAQIIVALMLVLMAEIRIRSLHGLFGVQQIPLWASIFLSLFTIIVVTNSFNLIDGVDGLASGVGLIGAVCFGVLFYMGGDLMMSILAFALAGSLAAFLVFNFSPAKIFMGDSGSLTIGLFMSILAIRYVEFKPVATSPEWLMCTTNPVVVMALLAYALTDTLRIFIYRAMKGLSPFSADRNHLHHLLVDSGFSHPGAVISIYVSMCIVIAVAILTSPLDNTLGFAITGGTVVVFIFIPVLIKRRFVKKNGNQSKTRRLDPMEAA
jgi:UDP-GlcNAc:undecaprenyl-phosphate GlcNAc-1-phosphate transferase